MLRLFGVFFVLTYLLSTFASAAFLQSNSNPEGIQVYQKNLSARPDNKKQLAEDINRYHEADDIWDTLRSEFSLNHYESNPVVQDKIEWYMENQDFLRRSAMRAAPYLYYILQQIRIRLFTNWGSWQRDRHKRLDLLF